MGLTAPPMPYLPPRPVGPPKIGLDLSDAAQAAAYHRFEAEREYETWLTGDAYAPIPASRLAFLQNKVVWFPLLEQTVAACRPSADLPFDLIMPAPAASGKGPPP